MQIIALLCLAAFAGVVLYQLYAVLGKRVGRQPDDQTPQTAEDWTFERPAASRDPNWTLTRVEAAQA